MVPYDVWLCFYMRFLCTISCSVEYCCLCSHGFFLKQRAKADTCNEDTEHEKATEITSEDDSSVDDLWSEGNYEPTVDDAQDYTVSMSAGDDPSFRFFSVSRLLDTGDASQDNMITLDESFRMGCSWSEYDGENFSMHTSYENLEAYLASDGVSNYIEMEEDSSSDDEGDDYNSSGDEDEEDFALSGQAVSYTALAVAATLLIN